MKAKHKHLKPRQKLIMANIANKTPEEICQKYGITLRTYQRIKEQFGTPNSIVSKYNRLKADYYRLKEHSKKQEEMVAVLQASEAKYSDPKNDKLNAADKLYPRFHPNAIIEALGISRGGFFNHVYRNKKDKAWFNVRRERLKPIVLDIYNESGGIYGAGRISGVMRNRGIIVGEPFVRDIMRELGIHGLENKLSNRRKGKISKSINRLIREFEAYGPNVLWATDFTEMEVGKEVIFLCVYIDIFSRRVVGRSYSSVADAKFVKRALKIALANRNNPKYLLVHSDQGAQYTSAEFREAADAFEIVQSFSRPGKPADNPVSESFFSTLKREEYRRHEYVSVQNLKAAVDKYIDWYNNERAHSALGYLSPVEYERRMRSHPELARRKRKNIGD